MDVKEPSPVSVRGALVERIHSASSSLASAVTLAEDIKDWLHDAIYKDLLVFETDIAQISSLVVIVLESAGALTELGLFVRNKHLKNKVLEFISEHHYQKDSFVTMGPLRYLERSNSACISSYPWSKSGKYMDMSGEFKGTLDSMISDVENLLADQDKSVAFDEGNEGHVSFFIFELLLTFRALKFGEIIDYLSCVGLPSSKELVKRLLFLLKKFGLVGEKRRGNVDYYFATSMDSRVQLGGKVDIAAATISSMRFYISSELEKKRVDIISSVYAGAPPAKSGKGAQ